MWWLGSKSFFWRRREDRRAWLELAHDGQFYSHTEAGSGEKGQEAVNRQGGRWGALTPPREEAAATTRRLVAPVWGTIAAFNKADQLLTKIKNICDLILAMSMGQRI
jgi:hypothetical protein